MDFMVIANIIGGMLAVVLIAAVVVLALGIIYYMGFWCLLQKMGRHDFAAIVPGYRIWEFARGAGFGSGLAFGAVLAPVVLLVLGAAFLMTFAYEGFWGDLAYSFMLAGDGGFSAAQFVSDLLMIEFNRPNPLLYGFVFVAFVCLVLHVYASYGVARSFGHGIGFTIGLVILPLVFVPILGWSHGQKYRGPYLEGDNYAYMNKNWSVAVDARLDAFGSNAPFVLALMGMTSGACLMTLPGIVLCVVALVRNTNEKSKPLSQPKYKATQITAWLGIIISIGLFGALFVSGVLANVVESLS